MNSANKVILAAAALLIVIVAYFLLLPQGAGNPYTFTYPIEKTTPLEVVRFIPGPEEGSYLKNSFYAVNANFLYFLDYQNNLLRYSHAGEFLQIEQATIAPEDTLVTGLAVNEVGDFIFVTLHEIITRFDGEMQVHSNRHRMRHVVLHNRRIFTLQPWESAGGIVTEYNENLKYVRSFGKTPYPMYGITDPQQFSSSIGMVGDDLLAVAEQMPTYSRNSITAFDGQHFTIEDSQLKGIIDYKKKELKDFHDHLGYLGTSFHGFAFSEKYLFVLVRDATHYFILEIDKGRVNKIYSLEIAEEEGVSEHGLNLVDISFITSKSGPQFVFSTWDYRIGLLQVKR